jgi:hypothetical protein
VLSLHRLTHPRGGDLEIVELLSVSFVVGQYGRVAVQLGLEPLDH